VIPAKAVIHTPVKNTDSRARLRPRRTKPRRDKFHGNGMDSRVRGNDDDTLRQGGAMTVKLPSVEPIV